MSTQSKVFLAGFIGLISGLISVVGIIPVLPGMLAGGLWFGIAGSLAVRFVAGIRIKWWQPVIFTIISTAACYGAIMLTSAGSGGSDFNILAFLIAGFGGGIVTVLGFQIFKVNFTLAEILVMALLGGLLSLLMFAPGSILTLFGGWQALMLAALIHTSLKKTKVQEPVIISEQTV